MKKIFISIAIFLSISAFSFAQDKSDLKTYFGYRIGDGDSITIESVLKNKCKITKTGSMMGFDMYNVSQCPMKFFDLQISILSLWFKDGKLHMINPEKINPDPNQWDNFIKNLESTAIDTKIKGGQTIFNFKDFSVTVFKEAKQFNVSVKQ